MKIETLHPLFLKCNSACTDTRKIIKNDMFFALKGDHFNGNAYAKQALELGAKYVIIDEPKFATANQTILVDNVLETLQQLASYHRQYLKLPIIALTGSNGKTTTKELIHAVLSQKYNTSATVGNLNNHIGVPLTLLSMTKHTEIGIVEMGANHLKEIEFLCGIAQPDYGYITNFGKAHLEGFGSVEGIIKGKCELYDYLMANHKTIFVNADDALQVEKTEQANTYTFGNGQQDVNLNFISAEPFVKLNYQNLDINSQLIGSYNFSNIAVSIAIGHYFKVDDKAMKTAIENYTPNNNRSQIIQKGPLKIILDAYNANPSSMRAALMNLEKQQDNKTVILGDMFELGDYAAKEHQAIVDLALLMNLDQIILVGENFFKCKNSSSKIKQFRSFKDFKNYFHSHKMEHGIILIKGSRGMALERALDCF